MSGSKQFVRIRFSKEGDIRFISHHDLMRLFRRALRRAGLPLAMSQGYNPRVRMSVPAPLSVGMAGLSEVLDIELQGWVSNDEIQENLSAHPPEGLALKGMSSTSYRPSRAPSELSYRVPLRDGHGLTEQKVRELLERSHLSIERRKKNKTETREIRPFIKALRLKDGVFHMRLKFTNKGTARPEEVLRALELTADEDYLESHIVRTRVQMSSSS